MYTLAGAAMCASAVFFAGLLFQVFEVVGPAPRVHTLGPRIIGFIPYATLAGGVLGLLARIYLNREDIAQ